MALASERQRLIHIYKQVGNVRKQLGTILQIPTHLSTLQLKRELQAQLAELHDQPIAQSLMD
jgi:hypothetical protein